ncbi:MAG: hypothetical protein HOH43_09085 [Candidatus Latescibacteria bacterium]|jgi:4-hydroxy-2-oxoheptanedioate aldolase|nr:hypothetical protein [Candidatus Latescibacterota bacterium]
MPNLLSQLLDSHDRLYGLVCRDLTDVDVELMANLGYHFAWIDLEHATMAPEKVVRLSRSLANQGIVPLVRIPELSRALVQVLLDDGVHILTLPDVRSAQQVAEFVALGMYPPLGRRGVSSTTVRTGYTLGDDTAATLASMNASTNLMAMIESDEGYEALDQILMVEGCQMMTFGYQDWCADSGLFGEPARVHIRPKADQLVSRSAKAGKTVTTVVSTPEEADHYAGLGARMFLVGVDISMKRQALADRIGQFPG